MKTRMIPRSVLLAGIALVLRPGGAHALLGGIGGGSSSSSERTKVIEREVEVEVPAFSGADLSEAFLAIAVKAKADGKELADRRRQQEIIHAAQILVSGKLEKIKQKFANDYTSGTGWSSSRTSQYGCLSASWTDECIVPDQVRSDNWTVVETKIDEMPTEVQPDGSYRITLRLVEGRLISTYAVQDNSFAPDTCQKKWWSVRKVVTRSGNLLTGQHKDHVREKSRQQKATNYQADRCVD